MRLQKAVAFLISDNSSYITRMELFVARWFAQVGDSLGAEGHGMYNRSPSETQGTLDLFRRGHPQPMTSSN
jgi:hypothetical protein